MDMKCQAVLIDLKNKVYNDILIHQKKRTWVEPFIKQLKEFNDGDEVIEGVIKTLKSFLAGNDKPANFQNSMRRHFKRLSWCGHIFPLERLFKRVVTLTSKKKTDVLIGKDSIQVTSLRPMHRALDKKLKSLEMEESIALVEEDIVVISELDKVLAQRQQMSFTEIGEWMFTRYWSDILSPSLVTKEVHAVLNNIIDKRNSKA